MEILMELAKLAPVIGLLIVGLIYFYKKENGYRAEICELKKDNDNRIEKMIVMNNQFIKDNEKDNLDMISKLADALEKLSDDTHDISKDLIELKHSINLKMEELRNSITK